jgi:single-strand DNA-binding protein
MNMQAVMTGKIGSDPVLRSTKSGSPMVTTSILVAVNRPGDPPDSQWFGVAAFGALAELLGGFAKGDTIRVAGTVTKGSYTTRAGEERENWNLTVDWILTAGEVPARGERPKSPQRRQPRQSSNRSFRPAFHDDSVEGLWRDGLVP